MTVEISVADRPISFYPKGWKINAPLDSSLREFHRGVQDGRWAQKISWLRDRVADKGVKGPDGKLTPAGLAYQNAKDALPCFAVGGTFRLGSRKKEALQESSGIRLLELDDLEPTAAVALRDRCKELRYGVAAWVSSSGRGVHLFAAQEPRATGKDDHASWQALATAVERDLGVKVSDHDDSVKDITRVAYVSHDPAAWINLEVVPEPWTPPTEGQQTPPGKASDVDSDRTLVPLALEFLASQGVGRDDSKLLAVGMCLKAMGHSFAEFDSWASSAGCTCTDRQARWDSLRATDTSYSAVIGMAVNAGWKRDTRKGKAKGRKSGGKQEARAGANAGATIITRNSAGLAIALDSLGVEYRRNKRRARHELRGHMAAQYSDGKHTAAEWVPLSTGFLAGLKERLAAEFLTISNGKPVPCRMSPEAIVGSFHALGGYRGVDPWEEWLDALTVWDGVERVGIMIKAAWPGEYLESEQYLAAAAWQIMGPAVARTRKPGIVADCCCVLLGPQGLGKTSALKALFPRYLRDDLYAEGLLLTAKDKEWVESSLGSVIAEFGEMGGAVRADVNRLKVLLSRNVDANIRLAYERAPQSFPRQWTGVGTANPDASGVLPDDAQNRRFLVVRMPGHDSKQADLDSGKLAEQARAARKWLAANRMQLWAEAVARWEVARGKPFWLRLKDEVADQQVVVNEGLRRTDISAVAIADSIDEVGKAGNLEALIGEALRELGSHANPSRNKVAGRLYELGWAKTNCRVNGKVARQWVPPARNQA